MARRTKPRKFTATLAERGELTNLRAIGEAVAQSIRDRASNDHTEEKQWKS